MKTMIVLFFLFLGLSSQAQVSFELPKSVELKACQNYSANRVHADYARCVRSNFATVEKVMSIELQKCYNSGNQVSAEFLGCIGGNFQKLINQTNLDVHFCYGTGKNMNSAFTNCVGRNFQQLAESFKVLSAGELASGTVDGISPVEGNLASIEPQNH